MNKIKILIPVYNDWKSVFKLLENIDLQIVKWDAEVSIYIINDASTESYSKSKLSFKNIKSIQVINMKQNRGHARCNAAGLKYLTEKENFDYVILMDGDGEDRPEELTSLFNKSNENPTKTVTLNRIKRSEGFFFKLLYELHKILTYIFTGKFIKFGNYSCLPKDHAARLVKEACIWSSFSGSVTKILPDRVSVPSIRGERYFGPSKMSFINLLKHSLSIIAVFKTTVLIRSIIFLAVYFFLVMQNISAITLIPLALIILLLISIFVLSGRENINELNNSLENISNIENLK